MIDIREIETILCATLDRAQSLGYSGYSKFDALHSPVVRALSFNFWPVRLLWTQLIMRAPINLRPLLCVRKGVNPESPALFARANLDLLSMSSTRPFKERAASCLDWLMANTSRERGDCHGSCWGLSSSMAEPGFLPTARLSQLLHHCHRRRGSSARLSTT